MADLRTVGVSRSYLDHLNRSAESFLVMWERSVALGVNTVNLARTASASASSTYCSSPGVHCYSPARVNDGDPSTTLGGFTSWANAVGPSYPQWVELQWTTPGDGDPRGAVHHHRLRDPRLRGPGLDGIRLDARRPPGVGNTSVHTTHTFAPPVTTSRLRVLGTNGPAIQPRHVRVNEIEVY